MATKKKFQAKLVLVTEDGESFLCIRQLYINDLYTGKLLNDKIYQGRRFKLVHEEEEADGKEI